ncbi:hypothetical protein FCM35_KLT16716 [Carex littledalei]|uniref:Uncharacterized protein n=1 Tax=Carex littledalei TaxID=544730 RepID=A0A833QZI0_9POAL|nr:hypothetical protein FCM35_KLT16716 [Carex littledalei]
MYRLDDRVPVKKSELLTYWPICFLDARITELETAAYPALDELTSKYSLDKS